MNIVSHKTGRLLAGLGLGAIAIATAHVARAATPVQIADCQDITAPGSYAIVANLKSTAFDRCLLINANNVTIDFGGHQVTNAGSTSNGVRVSSGSTNLPRTGITLKNGLVGGFTVGIDAFAANGVVISNMQVGVNKKDGIVAGSGAVITNTQVRSNGGRGLFAGAGSFIANVLADQNADTGIEALGGSTLRNNNESFSNLGIVVDGLPNSIVTGNLAEGNGQAGIVVDCPATVTGNKLPQFFPNGGRDILARDLDVVIPGNQEKFIKCDPLQKEAVVTHSSLDGFPTK